MKILIINVGASSTKLALYHDSTQTATETIRHPSKELSAYHNFWDQLPYRKKAVLDFLASHSYAVEDLDAIASRGPVVKPLQSGVYAISEAMLADARNGIYGMHPSGLGCEIAWQLSGGKIPCLTVDPPCVDEMAEVAKITGLPEIRRVSFFQALNHKAKGRQLAEQLGTTYESLNLVIVHLGSGISVASHKKGKVIDLTNGLEGDSPFGLDRVGTLPAGDWMRYCTSGKKTVSELHAIINGNGGIKAHLGTNNALEVEEKIQGGDARAALVFEAMAFQVGKGIGAAAAALGTRPDGLIITGGLANSPRFLGHLVPMVEWMAPLYIWPDDNEVLALALGALRGLRGEQAILTY